MTRRLQIVLCVAAAVALGALATSPYAETIDDSVFLIWAGLVVVLITSVAAVRSWWRHQIKGKPVPPASGWRKRMDELVSWLPWVG